MYMIQPFELWKIYGIHQHLRLLRPPLMEPPGSSKMYQTLIISLKSGSTALCQRTGFVSHAAFLVSCSMDVLSKILSALPTSNPSRL